MSRLHSTIIRLLFAASAAAQCSAISAAGKLRNVLRAPGAVVCPGVHDALSTKVFAEAGADVLFLSGFGVSACRGEPDAGIITRVEMEEVARQCVRAAGDVPLIVDGDTGFGGASNLRRTIRGFAEAGAAAVRSRPGVPEGARSQPAASGCGRDAAVARVRRRCERETRRDAGTSACDRGPIAGRRWASTRRSRGARRSTPSERTSFTPRTSKARTNTRSSATKSRVPISCSPNCSTTECSRRPTSRV